MSLASGRARMLSRQRRLLRAAITVVVLALAYLLAFLVRFEFNVPSEYLGLAAVTLPFVVALKLLLFRLLRVHRHSWQFTGLWDVVGITAVLCAAALIMAGSRLILAEVQALRGESLTVLVPMGVIAADLALSILGVVGVRALRRMQVEERSTKRLRDNRSTARRQRRVLLIGSGRAGGIVAREIQSRPDLQLNAIGFVDDDPAKQRQVMHGLEVLGTTADLERIVANHAVDEAVISITDPAGRIVRRLTESCRRAGIEARIIPGVYEILGGKVNLSRLRSVQIEDLLRRDPVELDTSAIAGLVEGQTVLVTGAGGSIGSELCRQLMRFAPRRLVLVEQAEGALWAIHRELGGSHPDVGLVAAIADVCDADRVEQVLAAHAPSLVFHAAAHKHVPMMEDNPSEAAKNNVGGTRTVVDACARQDVERFVLVSTDKAVRPTSVMGATKRVAERYVQDQAQALGRPYVSVRFGNVLGSAGSVVPVFRQQIADGGPVKVTHPDMRRYFMTIPEASELVIQAAALGTQGEIFVLDMGEPIKIVELARDLITLSGLTPDDDIEIEFTGVRPGEKLFEELALDSENTDRTTHPSVFVSTAADPGWDAVDAELPQLLVAAVAGDDALVRAQLGRLVPEMEMMQDEETVRAGQGATQGVDSHTGSVTAQGIER